MAYKIWLFLWYFVLASFCGWVAEVGYIGMVYRKFKNPGMLNGPYCPQYGLMIALPWAALTALHWQTSFVATLFFCLISSFLVEFTFAWLLRKTTHIRLRDYSKFKWNIKGYVSVPVATVRGVCFSFIVVFIVPVLTSLLHYVNRTVGWVILYAVLGIMLLDIIITSITVQRLNHQFKRLSELGDRVREARNALGNAVTGGAIGAAEAIDDLDLQKKLQEAQKTADENYTALLNKSNFLKRRFMSASPDMTNEQYEKELKAYRITTEERKKRSAERWKRNRYEYEATFENPEDRPFAFGMNFTKLFWIFFIGCLKNAGRSSSRTRLSCASALCTAHSSPFTAAAQPSSRCACISSTSRTTSSFLLPAASSVRRSSICAVGDRRCCSAPFRGITAARRSTLTAAQT